jgi:hypothetical protein
MRSFISFHSILGQMKPVRTFPPYILRYLIMLLSRLRLGLLSGFFLSSFPTKIVHIFHFSHICYLTQLQGKVKAVPVLN